MVSKKLDEEIQDLATQVRIFGNDMVHGGEIVKSDDMEVAVHLFDLMNEIIETTITRKNRRDKMRS